MQKQKILFIDRDGTIIVEPKENFQIDSLEKLEFIPAVIRNLYKIVTELDYRLVMVTNQDGLGTESYPEEDFWPAHNKMLKTLETEGITFHNIHIDRHFETDNAPTRKPGTAMLTVYLSGDNDLENSYVIGDRITDIRLAKNLGTKAFLLPSDDDMALLEKYDLKNTCLLTNTNWDEIYAFLRKIDRTASVHRKTKETDVLVSLDLDGTGKSEISTGLHFFDHMLEQIARHSSIDLTIQVEGDLQVDEHHTIEDTAITLGEAFHKALGSKAGIERYGFCLPMDDCLAQVAIDFGGRNWIEWEVDFKREKIGDMPTEMFFHFFKSFSDAAKCNLNIKAEGKNEHHKIEAIFKALAKAIKLAKKKDTGNNQLPSTKGVL